MSKTKRAFGAFLAASMLIALAAPGVAGVTSNFSSGADQTDYLNCVVAAVPSGTGTGNPPVAGETCSQVADGASTVRLDGDTTGDSDGSNEAVLITVSGASIVSVAGGQFAATGSNVTHPNDEQIDPADQIVIRAPSAAGTSVVSVYTTNPTTGVSSLEGTLTITWTATSGLAVSEANSTVKIVADGAGCAAAAITSRAANGGAADLCVTVRNANSGNVVGATVSVQITPVGLVDSDAATNPPGFGQTASEATDANGLATFDLLGSGVSGTSTIVISVTVGSTTTTFAPRTFVWAGDLASLTLSNVKFVGQCGAATTDAVKLVAKDTAGNTISNPADGQLQWISSSSNALGQLTSSGTAGQYNITNPSTAGTYTLAVRHTFTNALGQSVTVTSNTINWICSPAANPATDTWTLAFDVANVAPGGSAKLCATFKNSAGQPVPDGQYAIPDSARLVSSGALGSFSTTSNGQACATFLAPFASGQVSAVVTPPQAITPSSRTATITIGAPATSAGSALGIAPGGPFTTTTKVQVRGRYVTFRFDLGAAAANKPVTILAATKTGTTWSGFTAVTTRIANAQGVVIYYVRQSTATWKSYRAQESTTNVTPARQARWR